MTERYKKIVAAWKTALDGRDANTVSILDLLPAIYDEVPNTNDEEIVAALEWCKDKVSKEADELQRYAATR